MSIVSVIIPVYNTKPEYIQVAVDSILNQTMKDIEIIIVNDGSTNTDTLDFLKNLIAPQTNVINQKNLGLGGARNTGIKYATGKYIGFLDSDDWVDSNFYERLYNACEQNKADIACGTLSVSYPDGTIHNLDKYKHKTTRNNLTKIKYITNGSVCSKLFKKSLFDNTRFAEHLYYEDNPVLLQTLLMASRVTYVPDVHYWYRQHENSIVHDKDLTQKRRNDIFVVLAEISKIGKNHSYFVKRMAESRFSKILLGVSHYARNKEYKRCVQTLLKTQ